MPGTFPNYVPVKLFISSANKYFANNPAGPPLFLNISISPMTTNDSLALDTATLSILMSPLKKNSPGSPSSLVYIGENTPHPVRPLQGMNGAEGDAAQGIVFFIGQEMEIPPGEVLWLAGGLGGQGD